MSRFGDEIKITALIIRLRVTEKLTLLEFSSSLILVLRVLGVAFPTNVLSTSAVGEEVKGVSLASGCRISLGRHCVVSTG
jgi:hypothetical protein